MSSADTSGDFSLPAVPAQFDTTRMRAAKSDSKPLLKEEKQDENFDFNSYKTEAVVSEVQSGSKAGSSKKDFGSLFETKQKSIVNFSTCKLQSVSSVADKIAASVEPSAKKRKLKIKPMDFSVDTPPMPSTSVFKKEFKTASQMVKSPESINNSTNKEEQGKQYLKEVSYNHINIFLAKLI